MPRAPAAPGRPVRSRTESLCAGRTDGPCPGTGCCGPHVTARARLRAATPGWLRGHESAPGSLRTSLLGKWTERRCASPSVKEGGGGGGDGHPSPRCPQVPRVTRPSWAPSAASEVHPASQLQGEHPQGHGGQAAAGTGSTVTVLFVHFTPGLLAQDPLKAHGADAALVLVAGAAVLAEQELVIADIGCRVRERDVGVTPLGCSRN